MKPRLMVVPLLVFSFLVTCYPLRAEAASESAQIDALLNVFAKRGIITAADIDGIKVEIAQELKNMPVPAEPGKNLVKSFTGEKFSIGAGLRSSVRALEDGAPDDSGWSYNGNIDSARVYMNGTITDHFGVEFNTEFNSGNADSLRVLDAIVKYKYSDAFNIWLGRMLPASDRSNLDGPYYLNTFDFPGIVSRYPAIFAGRDDGINIHGSLLDEGRLEYVIGAFKGLTSSPNNAAHLLYAARLTYNFWDPEPAPWYYTGSTYYGDHDILAIGIVGQWQDDGNASGDRFLGGNVDILMEKKIESLGDGVLTLEGAIYGYDFDSAASDGGAYLGYVGWLFPEKFGPGKFQPHFRYQSFDHDNTQIDVGVNYVMNGHNGRLSLVWSAINPDGAQNQNQVLLGAQFQV